MNAIDTEIIRNLRRELGKRAIDATRMEISSVNGRVAITGTATTLRSRPEANVAEEIELFQKTFARDRLIKELLVQVIVKKGEETGHHEADPRGRMRQ